MFDRLFENRDRKISKLMYLGDHLGYSIREATAIFSIDDINKTVSYITKSNKVITGNYSVDESISLSNIEVIDGEEFTKGDKYDAGIKSKITNFIESLYEDNLVQANNGLSDIVSSWTTRSRYIKNLNTLQEKVNNFNITYDILDNKEFQNFLELKENFVQLLKENKESVLNNPQIINNLFVLNTVGKAFDYERLSLDDISEMGEYSVPNEVNENVYNLICQQELVRKELAESKENFDTIWITEESIGNLASLIFENDKEVIAKSLVEAVLEIPYLAIVSKGQLSNAIQGSLNTLYESLEYTKTDLKNFVALLFEMKKPLRDNLVSMIREKYGVNVNNIKDIPTFKSLINTQVSLLESLIKLTKPGSILRESMRSLASTLKSKNGVEAVDVTSYMMSMMIESGILNEEDVEVTISDIMSETISEVEAAQLINLVLEKETKDMEKELPHDDSEEAKDEEEPKKKKKKKSGSSKQDPTSSKDVKDDKVEKEDVVVAEEVSEEEITLSDLEAINKEINS